MTRPRRFRWKSGTLNRPSEGDGVVFHDDTVTLHFSVGSAVTLNRPGLYRDNDIGTVIQECEITKWLDEPPTLSDAEESQSSPARSVVVGGILFDCFLSGQRMMISVEHPENKPDEARYKLYIVSEGDDMHRTEGIVAGKIREIKP